MENSETPATPGTAGNNLQLESMSDRAYRSLEELISTLQLEPGQILSETALASQLGIGRTPIREALQRLAREGLVTILPRKGILVSAINPAKQLQLLEVRRALERMVSRSAALSASESERHEFREIAEGMERAAREGDEIIFMQHDADMNTLQIKAARNEYAGKAMDLLQGLSRRFWFAHNKTREDLSTCATLHAELARNIADGDADSASEASDRLLEFITEFTRATVLSPGRHS